MADAVFQKYEQLKHQLKQYSQVGIAYSGGVDSTVLLYAACEVLPKKNILALHGRSILNFSDDSATELYLEHFQKHAQLEIIEVTPLSLAEFVTNDATRCYHCKKMTYKRFQQFLTSRNISILMDGTNCDDMVEDRAGLAVLQELSVLTPLVDVGIGKQEIRMLARSFGLPNHSTPSNSCLATRLKYAPRITRDGVELVEKIEKYLKNLGYLGCRVKPLDRALLIELRDQDVMKFSRKHNRIMISKQCAEFGFTEIFVSINGRL